MASDALILGALSVSARRKVARADIKALQMAAWSVAAKLWNQHLKQIHPPPQPSALKTPSVTSTGTPLGSPPGSPPRTPLGTLPGTPPRTPLGTLPGSPPRTPQGTPPRSPPGTPPGNTTRNTTEITPGIATWIAPRNTNKNTYRRQKTDA